MHSLDTAAAQGLASHGSGPSEWRSGWRLVLAAFLGAALTSVPANTVGVFMPHLAAEFGWSRSQIAAAVPIYGWSIALSAPFIGALLDRFGARRFGLVGAVALPASIAALAFLTPSITSYWIGWGLVALAQIFANIMIWTFPVARHFRANRGAALALTLMGTSFTGLIYAPAAALSIEAWGWRATYAASGAIMILLVLPVAWLFFREPGGPRAAIPSPPLAPRAPAASGMALTEAVRTRQFWQLVLAVLLGAGSAVGLFIHMIPIARTFGLAPVAAATMVSGIALGSTLTKLVVGPVVDRMRAAPLAAFTMVAPAVTCAIFLFLQPLGYFPALAASLLIGIATGAELDMIAVLTTRYFGLRHFGRIYGVMQSAFQVATGSGPLLIGIGYDRSGNYATPLAIIAMALLTSSVLLAALGRERFPPARRPG